MNAVDKIMEQAQVFASSWSMVGSRFDNGNEIDNAHEQKADLRNMIEQALKEAAPVTCQIYGHVVGACVECNTHGEAENPAGYVRPSDNTFWPHPQSAAYAVAKPSLIPVYAKPGLGTKSVSLPMTAEEAKVMGEIWYLDDKSTIALIREVEAHHGIKP